MCNLKASVPCMSSIMVCCVAKSNPDSLNVGSLADASLPEFKLAETIMFSVDKFLLCSRIRRTQWTSLAEDLTSATDRKTSPFP